MRLLGGRLHPFVPLLHLLGNTTPHTHIALAQKRVGLNNVNMYTWFCFIKALQV